jgi:hypothetical protein
VCSPVGTLNGVVYVVNAPPSIRYSVFCTPEPDASSTAVSVTVGEPVTQPVAPAARLSAWEVAGAIVSVPPQGAAPSRRNESNARLRRPVGPQAAMPTFSGPLPPTWNGVTTGVQVVPSCENSALMLGSAAPSETART